MHPGKINIVWHIIGCALFLLLPLLLFPRPPEELFSFTSRPIQRDFIANGLMLGFFYLNFYWLIPNIYFRKKHALYAVCIVAGFLLVCLLPSLITGRIPWGVQTGGPPEHPPIPGKEWIPPRPKGSYFIEEIRDHIFLFAVVILFSLLLSIRYRWFLTEKARRDAEIDSLRAQINPHFLFNTLNSIYALTVRKDDKAGEAIIHLAGLMRYVIKDAQDNRIPLQKELDYINNYIELQKGRLRDTALIHVEREGLAGDMQIAPLILITFIENAFKYGINPDEDSEIAIYIQIRNHNLCLKAFNRKVPLAPGDLSTGIGLSNVRNRLQLLYPHKHRLLISDQPETYTVHLSIDLQ